MTRLTDDERGTILSLLQGGQSVHATARQVGRSKSTVSVVAHAAGIQPERSATKRATAAAREFDRAARLEALNRLAARVLELLEGEDDLSAKDLRDAAVALGIAVQRAREERGEERQVPAAQFNAVFMFPSNQRGPAPTDVAAWPDEIEVLPAPMLPADDEGSDQ